MTLSQRTASRFFAAFYRWNQHTQTRQCAIHTPIRRSSVRTPTKLYTRGYHATRLLRQQDGAHKDPQASETTSENTEAAQGQSSAHAVEKHEESNKSRSTGEGVANAEAVDEEVDADKLQNNVRKLMRKVPSSVAVVTVASFDPELKQHVPMGVAVSSLSTVTLNPPTISFNIKQPSNTLDAIRVADGRFRVHFPAADRGGASMVENFCRGNHAAAYAERKRSLKILIPGSDKNSSNLPVSVSRAPQIANDSVRAAMECTVTHELKVADHVILVARINSMESNEARDRTIIYVDGVYLRPNGDMVRSHGRPAETAADSWSVWDYPLTIGDSERRDYMERVKEIARQRPTELWKRAALRGLEGRLPMSPTAFGINLEQIIGELAQESGKRFDMPAHHKISTPLLEFYGRLSPSDRAMINERAKNMVGVDTVFLNQNFRVFLQYLGVSYASIDLLPSDISAPLRAGNLVGRFESRTQATARDSRDYDLKYLEQVEHRLVEHLTKIGHDEAIRTQIEDVMTSFGESRLIATYFNKARGRLYTKAFPHLFTPDKIDIAGDISAAEARVVVSRIIKFLRTDHPVLFRKNLNIDYRETLRLMRINPTITAFNVEYFFGKIRHIQTTTHYFHDLSGRLQEMLRPWFADTVTWADLEKRVKEFVQESPMRAMAWSNRDKLAAMGLAWEAMLTVPISSDKQPLNRGHILDTLVAKDLKGLYNQTTPPPCPPDVKSAIALYLKQQYNFDIKPADPIQLDTNVRSSSDDLHRAMLANRNVDVARSKVEGEEEEEDVALKYTGPRIRGIGDSKNANKHNQSGKEKERKGKTWSSYSLLDGKKYK